MDGGGPFRVPQPADRRVASRPEPASRTPEDPQPTVKKEEPKTVYRADESRRTEKEKRGLKKILLPIGIAVVVIVIALVGWFAWSNSHASTATAIDSSKYQAVFFTNGQVYFGKLQSFNSESLKLTDIYYLQTQSADASSTNPQKTSTDQNNVQLIKLGDEIHGPEDEMIISKDQVLFYENLKPDGKVAQSIANYKKS